MKIRGDGGACLVGADDRLREPGLARWVQKEAAIRLLQAPEGTRAFLRVPAGAFQRRGLAASFRFARATPLERRGPPQLERVSSLILSCPLVPVQGRSSSSCLSYLRCLHVVLPSGRRTRSTDFVRMVPPFLAPRRPKADLPAVNAGER